MMKIRTAKRLLGYTFGAIMVASGAAQAGGDLFIYNWTDYTAPELIEKFEAETGISVSIDTYDSNETLLAKLQAGGTGYDIVVPGQGFVPILIEEDLLLPINGPELLGYENITEQFKDPEWDPGNAYTIPWQWGTTSFTVNTDVFEGDLNSYDVLFQPPEELQGKVGMFRSAEEAIFQAQIALGVPQCSEDPAEMTKVLDLMKAQKPYVLTYSSTGILERLVSGDVLISQNWNGYSMRSRMEKPSLEYAYPPEGVPAWVDSLAVPRGSENYENAISFLEFMLRPENIALQSNFAGYANGVTGSEGYMAEDLIGQPELSAPADVPLIFGKTCSPEAVDLRNLVWTTLLE